MDGAAKLDPHCRNEPHMENVFDFLLIRTLHWRHVLAIHISFRFTDLSSSLLRFSLLAVPVLVSLIAVRYMGAVR